MSSGRKELVRTVGRILEKMEEAGDTPAGGGIHSWIQAVKANDGILHQYAEDLLDEALTKIVGEHLRGKRDPMTQARLFHSIEVEVGRDAEGNPIIERQYWGARYVYRDIAKTNQVVDYYVGQSRSFGKEANRTVEAARLVNPAYQRPLPFPDLDDDSEAS